MPRQAPASMPVLAGSATACSDGSTIDCAAVPKGRRHWPFQTQTRSPTRAGETPSPTWSLARAVAVRNDARKGDLARKAGAALDVGRVDAGDGEAHAHLAASGPRRLHFVDAQHVAGRSVGLVISSAHGMLPQPMDRRVRA